MISPFMAIYNNHVLTTCLSFPVCLTDAEKTQLNRLNMVACKCQPLFAVACETFFVHHDLSTTKRPDRTNQVVTLGRDLRVLKECHSYTKTRMKTRRPMPPPKKAPASRRQRIALVIKTVLRFERRCKATIHQKRTARS